MRYREIVTEASARTEAMPRVLAEQTMTTGSRF